MRMYVCFSKKYEFIFVKLLFTIFLSLLVTASHATSKTIEQSSSFYVGGGTGMSFLQAKTTNSTLAITNNSDLAINLLVGYQYNDNWSGELFWSYLGESKINSLLTNTMVGNVKQQSFGARGLFYYSLNKEWDITATAGVGVLYSSIKVLGGSGTKSDTSLQAGLGANWKFAESWELRTKYDYYNKSAQMLSFNIVKHFGTATEKLIPKLVKLKTCDEFFEKFKGITFAQSSAELSEDAKLKLDSLSLNILQMPIDITFEIRAHADDVGSELFNYQLSEVRAQIVRDYLSQKGIALSRMEVKGYGEWRSGKNMQFSNDNEMNRRVDLVLIGVEKYVKDISSCH